MKLIIDRASSKKGFYSIQFGPDFDIFIFQEEIWMSGVPFEAMSEIDRIVTGSVDLKFCVLYIKHPLLLENDTEDDRTRNYFFFEDIKARKMLRSYFALRLIYRRHHVDLYEIGRRLFV